MTSSEHIRVPYGLSVHDEEEIEAVVKVLRTSTQMGPHVREFESKVSDLYSKKHGIMVNSGSSALYLAVELLKLPEGSEVITPALTFSTTVGSLVKNKLIPVFADVELGTYNIDVAKIEALITAKTKALMIPNLLGNFPDWDELRKVADKHNLILIEDSADTLGSELRGTSTGARSEISTTSFYGSHVINCAGNGGMLCVNDDELHQRALLLRSWGRSSSVFVESEKIENRFDITVDGIKYDNKFVFEEIGYNVEPSEIGAAYGLVQLKKLASNIEKRAQNYSELYNFFSEYEKWLVLPKQQKDSHTGWLAFPMTLREDAPFKREDVQIFLEKRNIQTRTVFTGNILRQPGFKSIPHRATAEGYPEADRVMRGGFLVGCHHGLTSEMKSHIFNSFTEFAKSYRS